MTVTSEERSEWLSVSEAAALLGLSAWTLQRMMREGTSPPFYRPSQHARFKRAELEDWLETTKVTSPKEDPAA